MKKRMVMTILSGAILITGIAGCAPTETPAATLLTASPTPGSVYGEAPDLSELVAAGELPPVEERLPTNPLLVQPHDQVGVYGGTWQMGFTGIDCRGTMRKHAGYENLLRFDPAWTRILPNLAQSYDVNTDGSEFTFHLREGLKWSDGVPFTADDIVFWYEADLLNEDLHSSINSDFMVNDLPVVVEKIDNTTVRFSFVGSYAQFPNILAEISYDYITATPMHYLKQFHPDYNPDGIDQLVNESGMDNWVDLWKRMSDHRFNHEIPTMNAWVLTDRYDWGESPVVMERNPYYWKIDTDYNQLPYIDLILLTPYPSKEDLNIAAMNGQIDMQNIGIRDSNYDEYAVNKGTGEYEFHTLINPRANHFSIQLNLVHEDPVLRAVFSNKAFRIALSHAVNRMEVVEQVLGIDLEPRQPAPLKTSPYYRERLETQYIEYDPTYADELLDAVGYGERDAEGYRLTPDGQRINFTISVDNEVSGNFLKVAEMLSEYWGERGIMVNVAALESWPFRQLIRANEHDVVVTSVQGGHDVLENPGVYLPDNEYISYWAIPWVYWHDNNSLGEEPPESIKEQMRLFDQIKITLDKDDVVELTHQILEIAEEEFYVMGISLSPDLYMLVRTNFHNVPETMPFSWIWPTPGPTNPCQYFIDPQ